MTRRALIYCRRRRTERLTLAPWIHAAEDHHRYMGPHETDSVATRWTRPVAYHRPVRRYPIFKDSLHRATAIARVFILSAERGTVHC